MSSRFEALWGERPLTIETGHLAQQANGAVTVHYGDTVVLVTACASPALREGIDFLPLTVDYEERLYAAGKIPGGFIKREGRPSQDAVLVMRLTDRPLRPLFPKGFRNDLQVIITVLSTDQENDPDILAIIGASAALSISGIPFSGPVSAARVGYRNGELLLNPTYTTLQESQLDLVVASTAHAVTMVEGGAKEVPESVILEAIRFGHEANQEIIRLQEELMGAGGKPKLELKAPSPSSEIGEAVADFLSGRLEPALDTGGKGERHEALELLAEELEATLGKTYSSKELKAALEEQVTAGVRRNILLQGRRPDGRLPQAIRPLSCAVGLLPRTHGSGLFTRGETQVLSIVTLGSLGEGQRLDGLSPEEHKRFIHHYNFPPFSTGEVRRMGIPSRREIGHGSLVERALLPVIPDEEAFPYTIRLVSEVLSSNGSTSMASVCGSTLALMDAGVPIREPVAGVAMGLVMGEDGRFVVLTDIAGIEDATGDMDFKVAGTNVGITALQMDIKVKGLSYEVMEQALEQARESRLFILEKIRETIASSRPQLSRYAPRLVKIHINPDNIRLVIGPGGKVIRSIVQETKCDVEVEADGTVMIWSANEEAVQRAIRKIQELTREVEVGGIYTGKVTRLVSFGAFVEVLPGKEGLVHISELADYRVPSVEDVVQVGDEIMVMVTEIDKLGRINLSRRAVLQGVTEPVPPRSGYAPESRPPRPAPRPRPFTGPTPGPGLTPRRPYEGQRRSEPRPATPRYTPGRRPPPRP